MPCFVVGATSQAPAVAPATNGAHSATAGRRAHVLMRRVAPRLTGCQLLGRTWRAHVAGARPGGCWRVSELATFLRWSTSQSRLSAMP